MSESGKIDARLSRIYSAAGDKIALYDEMAATYDHDLVDDLGYVADAVACRKLISLVPDRSAKIIDAGCGTGLVGRRLKEAGYSNIHGNDYSPGMLEKARTTKAYQSLAQHDLTTPFQAPCVYDAAISVGVFGFSGPTAEHFTNITDCLKSGGIAVFTVNGKAWIEAGWEEELAVFADNHDDIQLIDVETIDYLTADQIDGRLLILRKLAP